MPRGRHDQLNRPSSLSHQGLGVKRWHGELQALHRSVVSAARSLEKRPGLAGPAGQHKSHVSARERKLYRCIWTDSKQQNMMMICTAAVACLKPLRQMLLSREPAYFLV